jgi:sporulation protein YlmC with PRC-barrel domain
MWPPVMLLRLERTHSLGGEKMKLELGTSIRCTDGATRELVDVVIDSGSSRVTHLVIRPAQHAEDARLVPISLASCAEKDGETEISLNCSAADVERFDPVHEFEVLHAGEPRKENPKWDVGVEDIVVSPNYAPSAFGDYVGALDSNVTISYDRVPKGEIELRHASSVYSADGHHLGSVDGVVVDESDRLTHLLLERGHLWWRREVALPAEAISKFESDMLTLGVTKREFAKADLKTS